MSHSRFQTARKLLIFWTFFIGLGAVAGAAAMLIDPSGRALGMDAMLPFFQVLPFAGVLFQNFIFSGWALLIVNGLSNLTAACLLLAKKKAGVVLGGVFGVTLMLWICIQFYTFPLNFMSTLYFLFGLCQAATGYAAWIFLQQESFRVDPADYPHIGADPCRLVVSSPAWATSESRPSPRPTGPAQPSMRSAPPSGPRARSASGGAAATGCTAGPCPSSRSRSTLPPMTT